MWCDLNGLSHGRYVPERRLNEHGRHAVTTLTMGIDREILPVDGYAADVGFPDLSTVPLRETRRPGWEVDTDVVDVTNLVLMESGQPLHAFDLAKLRGGRIVVRRAEPGRRRGDRPSDPRTVMSTGTASITPPARGR